MLRRKERLFVEIMVATDVLTLTASFTLAYFVRKYFFGPAHNFLPPFSDYFFVIWIIVPAFVLSLTCCGLYRSATYRTRTAILGSVMEAAVLGTLIVLGVLYMTKRTDLGRLVVDIFALLSVAALVAEKFAITGVLDRAAERRRKRREWQVLLVGEDEQAKEYVRLLEAHPHWGVAVAGIVNPHERVRLAVASGGEFDSNHFVTGAVDWRELLKGYVVDEVVAVTPWSKAAENLSDLQEACAERGLIFRMLVAMPLPRIGHYNVEDLGAGSYLVSLETVPQDFLPLLFKRGIDIAGSLVGLLLYGLVYLWYARRLARESPGPVLFVQKRVGRNGRVFDCYKFRTMLPDAEQQQERLLARSKLGGVFIKVKNDPRVTPTGAWLRRHYLDELPQFWNVLVGQMSLIGPRPSQPVEVSRYGDMHYRRLSMKPGITGMFQINGHATTQNFEEVVRLDCEYIDRWSLWLDCKIFMKTLRKFFRADGW